MTPAAPIPATSDGVAQPSYIATMMTDDQDMNGRKRGSDSNRSRQREVLVLEDRRRRAALLRKLRARPCAPSGYLITTQTANNSVSMMPGPNPAMNSRPIDCSEASPYRISVSDGGIRMPSVPPAAMSPAARPSE